MIYTQQHSPELRRTVDDIEVVLRNLDRQIDKPFGDPIFVSSAATVPLSSVVLVDPSAGALVLSIQYLDSTDIGKLIVIKNNSSSTNTIIVQCVGAVIDGASSQAITTARGVLRLYVIKTTELVAI